MKKIFFILLFFISTSAIVSFVNAQYTKTASTSDSAKIRPKLTLAKVTLPDQFDSQQSIDEKTEWVIFSTDSYTSDLIKKALEDLKVTDFQAARGAYVADISAMPSMITKMLALPEMKKYPFKILLDKEGDITKNWPREKGKATLLQLKNFDVKNLEITSEKITVKFDEIKSFLSSNFAAKP